MNTSPQLSIEINGAPPPAAKSLDLAAFAPAILAAFFVGMGWIVVERYARRREIRSDLRDAADLFEDTVDDIVAMACKFYLLAGADPHSVSLATSIKSKIQALSPLIDVLSGGGIRVDARDAIRLFRQAVTGGSFESITRGALPESSPMFTKMEAAGQDLVQIVRLSVFQTLIDRKASKPKRRPLRRPVPQKDASEGVKPASLV
ncbi:hypothetical protein [Sphingomonas mali]|uniref:hypothetical protein n=1 Tax=Sphingomonas mali TaxID=40682 RepID=UPI0012EDF074|nr:hypothetical protein [Sphingomonas mali]